MSTFRLYFRALLGTFFLKVFFKLIQYGHRIGKKVYRLISEGLYQSSGKEKESCCLVFLPSIKRENRHFHVVVVQRRLRNVQKSVMHVPSCCFTNLTYCLFAVPVAVAVVVS